MFVFVLMDVFFFMLIDIFVFMIVVFVIDLRVVCKLSVKLFRIFSNKFSSFRDGTLSRDGVCVVCVKYLGE